MAIPSRIIQTARTHDLSGLARAAAKNLKLLHPNWEFIFFDDADVNDFVSNEFPHYKELFFSFPYKIQRFDFFRYLAIYHFGGFYFDLDVHLWRELTDLLPNTCVFPFEELTLNRHLRSNLNIDWEIGNYAFASEPKHPFLAAIIENCVRARRDRSWLAPMLFGFPRFFRSDFEVLNSTGPGLITRTLVENPEAARHVTVLFPPDVCNSDTWHHFGDYGLHAMEGSWRTKGSYIRRRVASLWEVRIRNENLARSRALGPCRTLPGRTRAEPPRVSLAEPSTVAVN
jgi:hypothetical protein